MTSLSNKELEEIREAVADNWRQFLTFAAEGNQALGAQIITRFDEKAKAYASTLAPDNAAAYLEAVEQERNNMFDAYTADPEGLKRRLGVKPRSVAVTDQRSQGIGEVAVKTAVRAGIWAAIWELFR